MDWAKASGFRDGENPSGGATKGLPRQPDRKNHFAALPYQEVADFVGKLRACDASDSAKLAFEFLILTAARTSETLGATWAEIDPDKAVWTIPANRMKAQREHRVPLSNRCTEILAHARKTSDGSGYVFSGRSTDKPLSNMVFLMTLRRMNVGVTVRGFRSAFRDCAAERTNFPREVRELALAHTNKNKVKAAYQRGDLFDKRRELMDTWSRFATSAEPSVVSLRAG